MVSFLKDDYGYYNGVNVEKVGIINIIEDGKIISTIDATIKEDIEKANIFTRFGLKSWWTC